MGFRIFPVGFKDGSNGGNNAGVVDFDGIGGEPQIIWLGGGKTSFSVGDTFGEAGRFDRTYSIEALATAVIIPEPATLAIWGLGLLVLSACARRRRR